MLVRQLAEGRRSFKRGFAVGLIPVAQSAMLGVGQPYNKEAATWGNGTMIALQMPSKEKVHEVYDAALKAGGSDEGPAGARGDTFYAGYFRDLDGNKLCAFYSPGM